MGSEKSITLLLYWIDASSAGDMLLFVFCKAIHCVQMDAFYAVSWIWESIHYMLPYCVRRTMLETCQRIRLSDLLINLLSKKLFDAQFSSIHLFLSSLFHVISFWKRSLNGSNRREKIHSQNTVRFHWSAVIRFEMKSRNSKSIISYRWWVVE